MTLTQLEYTLAVAEEEISQLLPKMFCNTPTLVCKAKIRR